MADNDTADATQDLDDIEVVAAIVVADVEVAAAVVIVAVVAVVAVAVVAIVVATAVAGEYIQGHFSLLPD